MKQPEETAQGVGPSKDSAAETAALSETCKISPRKKRGQAGLKRTRAEEAKVAALLGAGMPSRDIGRQLGIPSRTVRDMTARIEKDPELAGIRQAAVDRLRDQAIEIVGRRLKTLDDGFEGASLKEQATAFREIREVAMPRTWNEFTPPSQGPQIKLQTDNPAVMASFVEALRMLNEPSARTVEAEVVSEETK